MYSLWGKVITVYFCFFVKALNDDAFKKVFLFVRLFSNLSTPI